MDKIFVYMGNGEVFKPEFNKAIEPAVPISVPALLEDLFENDPNFVEVDEKKGAEIKKNLDAARLKGRKDYLDARAKTQADLSQVHLVHLQRWYKQRDEARAARLTAPAPAPPQAPKKG